MPIFHVEAAPCLRCTVAVVPVGNACTRLLSRCLAVPGASAVRLVAATSASVQRGDGQQILVDRLS